MMENKVKRVHHSAYIFMLGIFFGCLTAYVIFTWENIHYLMEIKTKTPSSTTIRTHTYDIQNRTVTEDISKKIRVLCWVPSTFKRTSAMLAIYQTWGTRCDTLLFFANQTKHLNKNLAIIGLDTKEGRKYLWSKTKESLKYIYKNYFDQADWFLKADDDTYVVMENLKYFLLNKNTSRPVQFGSKFAVRRDYLSFGGYMYGGSGYVLSKEALRRFIEKGLKNKTVCKQDEVGNEDLLLSEALIKLDVELGDTRDFVGRATFLPGVLSEHLSPRLKPTIFWIWNNIIYKHKRGIEYCSERAITFHKITWKQMLFIDYLIYNLRAFGFN